MLRNLLGSLAFLILILITIATAVCLLLGSLGADRLATTSSLSLHLLFIGGKHGRRVGVGGGVIVKFATGGYAWGAGASRAIHGRFHDFGLDLAPLATG